MQGLARNMVTLECDGVFMDVEQIGDVLRVQRVSLGRVLSTRTVAAKNQGLLEQKQDRLIAELLGQGWTVTWDLRRR